jgi:hypothetical protein
MQSTSGQYTTQAADLPACIALLLRYWMWVLDVCTGDECMSHHQCSQHQRNEFSWAEAVLHTHLMQHACHPWSERPGTGGAGPLLQQTASPLLHGWIPACDG